MAAQAGDGQIRKAAHSMGAVNKHGYASIPVQACRLAQNEGVGYLTEEWHRLQLLPTAWAPSTSMGTPASLQAYRFTHHERVCILIKEQHRLQLLPTACAPSTSAATPASLRKQTVWHSNRLCDQGMAHVQAPVAAHSMCAVNKHGHASIPAQHTGRRRHGIVWMRSNPGVDR
jgi:hypothetical protein